MGNVSVFLDAGYLYRQGSLAVLGARLGRHEVALDATRFVRELTDWIETSYPADTLLRTYWYDGAKRGVPTLDQLDIAALPFVKLRLGRISSSGQQKGVDTLVLRDLMVLSQERSIHRAVVVSGDEDLREGIEYAQDRGVWVAVAGIDAEGDRAQSIELVRAADETLSLPAELLEHSLSRRPSVEEPNALDRPPGASAALTASQAAELAALADAFARDWCGKAAASEIAAVAAGFPKIPRELDSLLLQRAVRDSGVYNIDEESRRAIRAAFWAIIDAETSA